MIHAIARWILKEEVNKCIIDSFNNGTRVGREVALKEMVEEGQNGYRCKYCNTSVAQSIIDRDTLKC